MSTHDATCERLVLGALSTLPSGAMINFSLCQWLIVYVHNMFATHGMYIYNNFIVRVQQRRNVDNQVLV